jgi:integrase
MAVRGLRWRVLAMIVWRGTFRGNPCGKRDYAIILLITRLGLRGIDVKRLRFANLDWPGNRLSVVGAQTGHRVQLPLLKDVGWAVIDYIRHGRPRSEGPQVFLRHTAPIGPFSDQDHLHQILVKHARAAHVPLGEKRRHGMHSLRHTLATQFGVPLPYIPDILGHVDLSTTEIYARASTEAKRKALEAVYADVVTTDLAEWNQNPELLNWLASL